MHIYEWIYQIFCKSYYQRWNQVPNTSSKSYPGISQTSYSSSAAALFRNADFFSRASDNAIVQAMHLMIGKEYAHQGLFSCELTPTEIRLRMTANYSFTYPLFTLNCPIHYHLIFPIYARRPIYPRRATMPMIDWAQTAFFYIKPWQKYNFVTVSISQ